MNDQSAQRKKKTRRCIPHSEQKAARAFADSETTTTPLTRSMATAAGMRKLTKKQLTERLESLGLTVFRDDSKDDLLARLARAAAQHAACRRDAGDAAVAQETPITPPTRKEYPQRKKARILLPTSQRVWYAAQTQPPPPTALMLRAAELEKWGVGGCATEEYAA